MDDFQAPPLGTEGEVIEVDDTGTIHVQWATGSTLGAVYGEDKVELVDRVVTICYGKKREWASRNEAIAFYVDCMLNSEGAEQERYLEIYIDLMAGKTLCLDEKSAKNRSKIYRKINIYYRISAQIDWIYVCFRGNIHLQKTKGGTPQMKNTQRQIEGMKKQTIGVEIEMADITRQKAIKVVANYFGTGNTVRHDGGSYDAWSCLDNQNRRWTITRDVSIRADRDEEKAELATPILKYEDIEDLQR